MLTSELTVRMLTYNVNVIGRVLLSSNPRHYITLHYITKPFIPSLVERRAYKKECCEVFIHHNCISLRTADVFPVAIETPLFTSSLASRIVLMETRVTAGCYIHQ